jgi:acetoin utilization deacetylase AcuC-like enzyme
MSEPIPVVTSSAHLGHDGLIEVMAGRPVPCFEKPERITQIERALAGLDWVRFLEPIVHGRDPISAVHDPELVDLLEHVWTDALAAGDTDGSGPLIPDTFLIGPYAAGGYIGRGTNRVARLGAYCLDTATPIVEGTFPAALAAVDVALTAADLVVAGERLAYALCRPPGHHAAREMYGGYCFFNNAAIVAQNLAKDGGRVAILDIDYHHGNGTQQIFWERDDVLYVSLHGDPARAFPYFSGHADERGAGRGKGCTRNVPLPAGAEIARYLEALDNACELVERFAPDAPLIVSLGFDTYVDDPISDLALRTEDYAIVAARISRLGLPTILIQEGGYAIEAIGPNAVSFVRGFTGR